MDFLGRIIIWFFLLFFIIIMLGFYSEQKRKEKLHTYLMMQKSNEPIPDLGVKPQKKPTRIISFSSQEKECLTKDEFYEGMEDAEMKGNADDPSAQDIYDEFNR